MASPCQRDDVLASVGQVKAADGTEQPARAVAVRPHPGRGAETVVVSPIGEGGAFGRERRRPLGRRGRFRGGLHALGFDPGAETLADLDRGFLHGTRPDRG